MPLPSRCAVVLHAAAILIAAILFMAACGGGQRPTITTDRIAEQAPLTASEGAPQAAAEETEPDPTDDIVDEEAPAESVEEADDPADNAPDNPADNAPDSAPAVPSDGIERFTVEVIESFPHDTDAFTQGLELHNGELFESTGLSGQSDLRRTSLDGEVLQIVPTPSNFFAEGLTRVGDELIQLTWQNGTAFYWDATTFELIRQVNYSGEGWGLCFDGQWLIMTDGDPELILRDPVTFDEIARVLVTRDGVPLEQMNEVECVDGMVWANIWESDEIVRIDPTTGQVTGIVDATSIKFNGAPGAVLNGIAWDAENQNFLITGKLWPTLYRVNFVPVPTS